MGPARTVCLLLAAVVSATFGSVAGCGGEKAPPPAPKGGGCPPTMAEIPPRPREGKGDAPAFCVDRTEVTLAQYAECVGRAKCSPWEEGRGCNRDDLASQAHPINCVDATQAADYCAWRGKRLPTEAEWVWAASGGGRAPEVGGACYSGSMPQAGTCPVDRPSAVASPQGASDLTGNVAEWTATPAGSARIVRGAHFGTTDVAELSSLPRREVAPQTKSPAIGFRCARDK